MLETYKDSTYLSKYDGQGISRVKFLEQKVSHIFSSSLEKDYVGYGDTYNFINYSKEDEGHFGIIDIDGNRMTIVNLLTNQPSSDGIWEDDCWWPSGGDRWKAVVKCDSGRAVAETPVITFVNGEWKVEM
ncbi:MAG: hypothetical protein IKH88_18200 [Prevotella sp.]|nr:hypothetical protein [Prevotella sp.]